MRAYARLARTPGFPGLMAAQLLARLPQGLIAIAVLLHVEDQLDSYTVAGAVVACEGIGQAASAPLASRAAAINGVRRVLTVMTAVHVVALSTLAVVPLSVWPALILGACVGASTPPVVPVVRTIYPRLVRAEELPAVFALDTTAQELIWISGPVIATLVAGTLSTSLGLLVAAVSAAVGVGALLMSVAIRQARLAPSLGAAGQVLRNPTVAAAMAGTLAMIATFTSMEVAALAKYDSNGQLAGAALALASGGSLIGGVILGSRRLSRGSVVLCLLTGVVGPLAAAVLPGTALFMAAYFVSGLGFAPALAALHHSVSVTVEDHDSAEAFGWLMTAGTLGAALGTLVGGWLIDSIDVTGALVGATAFGSIAVAIPVLTRVIPRSEAVGLTER